MNVETKRKNSFGGKLASHKNGKPRHFNKVLKSKHLMALIRKERQRLTVCK
jgi:hypothetical protein